MFYGSVVMALTLFCSAPLSSYIFPSIEEHQVPESFKPHHSEGFGVGKKASQRSKVNMRSSHKSRTYRYVDCIYTIVCCIIIITPANQPRRIFIHNSSSSLIRVHLSCKVHACKSDGSFQHVHILIMTNECFFMQMF